jgi:hypothetical protein
MRVLVHGCGGAGVNITAQEIERLKQDVKVFGLVETRYIDTATADINEYEFIPDSDKFIISSGKLNKNIDGAGGVRESLNEFITEAVKNYVDCLDKHSDDIHIVISSASGGSGSLIAPRLIHNLKTLKLPVIYIMVTDTSSVMYCDNSLKTAKHIEVAGNKYNYSIPTIMIDNKDAVDVVNARVGLQVEQLAILCNGNHKSLDTTDMLMFIGNAYDKEATGLVTLSIHTNDTISKLSDSFISTLRILTDDRLFKLDTNVLSKVRQYKQGYPNDDVVARIKECKLPLPLYFAITTNSALAKLDAIKTDLTKKFKIKEDKKVFFDDDDIGIEI